MQTPRINPEFKDLIPPLTPSEFTQLEQNIQANGCRDPITLWRGTIVDGHNRYEICTKHGIRYETATMHFPNRDAARLWILENQLGRRNLTDAMRIELAARKAEYMGIKTYVNKFIAGEVALSDKTVQHYMQIKTQGDPELIQKVMAGEIKIGTAHRQLSATPHIEVITTTVEGYKVPEMPPKDRIAIHKRAATGNIRLIGNLYAFLSRHRQDCEDIPDSIPRRLAAHGKRLGKLIGSL